MSLDTIKVRDLYILLYLLLFIIHYYTDVSFTITYMAWILCGLSGYLVFKEPLGRNYKVMFPLALMDLIALVNLGLTGNHSVFNALMLPVSQMFGMYLYEYRKKMKKVVIFTYIMIAYMFAYIMVMPKTLANASLNEWFTYFSDIMGGNTISIFLLLFLTIDIIYRHTNNLKVNYIPFLASLLMAYKGGGTGGVLSITVLLIGIIALKWDNDKISKEKVICMIVVGVTGITVIGKWQYLIAKLTDDNSRFWIWSHYYQCATHSVKEFFCGGDVSGIAFLAYQKNMHNTFINWHYYYGLIPFVFMLIMMFSTMLRSFMQKKMILLVVLCVLFLRAFTDETTFCFMPIWAYALLDVTNQRKEDHKSRFGKSELRKKTQCSTTMEKL